jgi:hypothetical protein
MSELIPFAIEKFLGENRSATETLLKLGEASYMSNWMITDDNKLQKMFGYAALFASLGSHKINGIWYGELNEAEHFLFACNGHIYKQDETTHENTDLGVVVDSFPTTFFVSNNTVYILDGSDFYSWSGSGSISRVTGYVPTILTAVPPTGGGTILENINYINGQKSIKMSSKAGVTVYQLPELNIESFDSLIINGATKTKDVDYTVNLTNGTFTLVSAIADGTNNMFPTWTKTVEGDREAITNNQYYGGTYYARFWLYGNPNHKNTRYCNGVTLAGVSDPTYWPKFTDSDVGEHAITAIETQYDKQIIFTDGDAAGADSWYSTEKTYLDENSGLEITVYPVYNMNSKVGNQAKGQVRIILNNPFTLWKGIYEWVATNVQNEKNVVWRSKRVQPDLDTRDLSKALTWDWDDKGIYILAIGKVVWMYNYHVNGDGEEPGVWYHLDLPDEPTCFITINKKLYFGTTNGQIMKFDESLKTYNGQVIKAVWKMGFFNFTVDWLRKFIQRMYVTILPRIKTHVNLTYDTDRGSSPEALTAQYSLNTFEHLNFAKFSFKTNYSPQPFKFKIRAKKIDYLKLIITNDDTDTATVLNITLPTRTGGEVKNRR